jgi:two-component sensor histidine kinase
VITVRKKAENEIQKNLAEKTALLRELYHRTKNNMTVIIALLEMQAQTFQDERLREEFNVAKNRIRSMALVHQKLYESSNLSRINLKEYLHDLVQVLVDSYRVSNPAISTRFDLQDAYVLIDTAIPCGLIVNELVANSLKHAFSTGEYGEILVEVHASEQGEITLALADNGKGVPDGFDFRRDGHMGLQTIHILGENQLQGRVEFEAHKGVKCTVRFQDELYGARV